ncbi:hypothetical protein QYF36_007957 [Acer negundo]|nr:hypothetical protein QYF36_025684 [Acer negundo]KAK4850576.1 hypothetical protein QYF36_007957 [Acer negundo]
MYSAIVAELGWLNKGVWRRCGGKMYKGLPCICKAYYYAFDQVGDEGIYDQNASGHMQKVGCAKVHHKDGALYTLNRRVFYKRNVIWWIDMTIQEKGCHDN